MLQQHLCYVWCDPTCIQVTSPRWVSTDWMYLSLDAGKAEAAENWHITMMLQHMGP